MISSIAAFLTRGQEVQSAAPLFKIDTAIFSSTKPRVLLLKAAEAAQVINEASREDRAAPTPAIKEAKIFLFNMAELMFRQFWHHPSEREQWQREFEGLGEKRSLLEGSAVEKALNSKSLTPDVQSRMLVHHGVVTFAERGAFARTISNIVPAPIAKEKPRDLRQLKIVQSSLETPHHRFAGLATVVADLAAAHKKWTQESSDNAPSYQGFYPLYEMDKYVASFNIEECQPYAVIPHYFEHKLVYSVIYKSKEQQAFFVSPDPEFSTIFDVGASNDKLYNPHHGFAVLDRGRYMGSALAVFAALYRGRSGDKLVDVVRGDNLCVAAPCFAVLDSMKDLMSKKDIQALLPAKIAILHGPSHEEVGDSQSIGIGAGTSPAHLTNVAAVARMADRLIAVSNHYRSLLIGFNPIGNEGLSVHLNETERLVFKSRLHAITNGFNPQAFDPALVTGINRGLDEKAFGLAFTGMKTELTEGLFKAGKIGDPAKPIVFYVGRWYRDKGIEHLPAIAKMVIELGGQFVVMGVNAGFMEPIRELRLMAKDEPLIRIYEPAEQRQLISYTSKVETKDGVNAVECKAALGLLIRSAASLGVVLSHHEPMGLVPVETILSCPVILPYHEGFLDTMVPYKKEDIHGKTHDFTTGATAFTYENSHEISQVLGAVRTAFAEFVLLPSGQKEPILKALRQTAYSYAWYRGPKTKATIHRLMGVYTKAIAQISPRDFVYKAPARLDVSRITDSPVVNSSSPVCSSVDGSPVDGFSVISEGGKAPQLLESSLTRAEILDEAAGSTAQSPSKASQEFGSGLKPAVEEVSKVDVDTSLGGEEIEPAPILPSSMKISKISLAKVKLIELFQKIISIVKSFFSCLKSVALGRRQLFRWKDKVEFQPMSQRRLVQVTS